MLDVISFILTKTGILMQIQREQSRRIGMMIIFYFHISIGFSYGEYLQSLPWPKYCIHKYDIVFILENTHYLVWHDKLSMYSKTVLNMRTSRNNIEI